MSIVKKQISNVVLMPAVEGISRKLALRREKCTDVVSKAIGGGASCCWNIPGHTYMGVVSKVVNINGVGTVRKNTLFMRKPVSFDTYSAKTEEALANRQHFAAANAWVNAAWRDLSAMIPNQEKYLAAKQDFSKSISGVSAYGYQSQRGWMKAVAFAILADGGSLPQNHQLPAFDA